MNHAIFKEFIQRNRWIFAKTYASFCPHEYIVKDHLSKDEQAIFIQAVQFIRDNGFLAIYGKKEPNHYFIVDDHYYWTMGEPVEITTILNRAKLDDYCFIQTDRGLIVKRKE